MQKLTLADRLTFTASHRHGEHDVVVAGGPPLQKEENLVYRALDLWFQESAGRGRVQVQLEKHIPAAAGLGGGSADAAQTLRWLNERAAFFGTRPLTDPALLALATRLGADVPFSLFGVTAACQGIGERLEALDPLPPLPVLLVGGHGQVQTGPAFQRLDQLGPDRRHYQHEAVVAALRAGQVAAWTKQNRFLDVLPPQLLVPSTAAVAAGLLYGGLSGSGPTHFFILPDQSALERAASAYEQAPWQVWRTELATQI